ncbi:hypothetical protein JJV70_13790 [Streptomyces sp. JJ66]|uniref:hypothetical protein n=1 Tax=Streptomyces sp. JJ66 TaxID=2803843 RepID=UPI001C585FF1|nr:hypothetical protein [Streptomyces sp. JJ66]MBW1603156.1 hypothetical protein [Streptomyces sp. JJ66]
MRTPDDGAVSDIDWEGERRWYDGTWAVAFRAVMVTSLVVPLFAWVLVDAEQLSGFADWPLDARLGLGFAVWLLVASVGVPLGLYLRHRLARRVGVTLRRLPVLVRRLRQERVPRDPVARRAMAQLVRLQRAQLRQTRWAVFSAPLYLLLALLSWFVDLPRQMAMFLALAVGALWLPFSYRRITARLDRVEERLRDADAAESAGAVRAREGAPGVSGQR